MVLGELVLRPIPDEVAQSVAAYAQALGIDDDFVRVARRYAKGAFGLAWVDLRRSGFTDRWDESTTGVLHTSVGFNNPFDYTPADPALEAIWAAFADLPPETLGRQIWEMYDRRGFALPGMRRARRRSSPNTTSCTCSPTTTPTSKGSWRRSRSSGGPTPTRRGSRGSRRWSACSRPGTSTSRASSRSTCASGSWRARAWAPGSPTPSGAGRPSPSTSTPISSPSTSMPLPVATSPTCARCSHLPPKSPEAIAAGSVGIADPAGMSERQREVFAQRRAG